MIVFRVLCWFLVLVLMNCSHFSKKKNSETETSVHLLLNSTGMATEFCVFEVEKTQNLDCVNPTPPKSYSKCVEYFPENSISTAITSKETLDQLYKGLAQMELSRPKLKQSIQNVGYIITGSLNSEKSAETKKTLNDVESHFKAQEMNIKTMALSGQEEAKITAIAIEESNSLEKPAGKDSALLQIGPDTVEVIPSLSGKNSKISSSKIGIQLILEELSNIKPGINTCRQPISAFFKSEASSYEKCKEFIKENLNKSNRLSSFTKLELGDSYHVYSTGSTWNYYYPNIDIITVEDLNKTGNEFCSLTIDDILKKGIKKKNAYNLCYSLAFKAVLAETLGIKKLHILQKEIYLKNLAKTSTLFPEVCR